MERQNYICNTPDCIHWEEKNGCAKRACILIQERCCIDYEAKKAAPRITIHVSGGMVQNIYTDLETDLEVDVLDFDDNGNRTGNERKKMEKRLHRAVSKQRQIY